MWDNFKAWFFSDNSTPTILYILTVLSVLSGDTIEAAIFFAGGGMSDILLKIKTLLEKQTNTINNDGENN